MATETTTARHTPGPWSFERIDFESIRINAPGHVIATVTGGSTISEHQANAYLIASAPALLEALERALQRAKSRIKALPAGREREWGLSGLEAERDDLAAAIAQATGQEA